jgi:O-antigen ligase
MFIYTIIIVWSMSLFGAVHTYAYTFMNIGIIIAFCRYCIHCDKQSIQLILPKLKINTLFIIFSLIILFYIFPLPQSLIQFLSPESAKMNELAQSPMDIVHCIPLQWGTLAVSNYPVRHAWVQYMVYVLFFWGLLLFLKQEKNIKDLCLFLIFIGTIESLYGLSQTFINSGYILWVPKALFQNKHDACGTLINRNHFAALITMLMLLSMAYSASQTGRKKTKVTSFKRKLARFLTNEYQWNQKIIGITAASIMGLGIYFSSSRGAASAALPGVVVLIVSLSSRKSTKKQAFVMIVVGLILLVSTVSIGEDRLIHRFQAVQRAMESRMRYIHSTIDLISDYAIFGVGPSNFTHAFARYQSAKDQQVTVTHSHNDWLQFVSEMGILGLTCLLAILFTFIWKIVYRFRKRTSPSAICLGITPIAVLASISAHSLFDFPLHIPGNMLILVAICALGFQALHIIKYKNQSKTIIDDLEIPFTFRHIGIWIAFLIMLVSMTLISTCHFIAESYCNTIPNSTLNRNQNPSKEAIQKAIFWDPGNPVHWYKIAWHHIAYRNTLSETNNSMDWLYVQKKVIFALEQAVANNPCEAEYHIRLAWAYHHMQYHETGNQKQSRIEASDIAMKHAAIVCGNKNFSQHMEIANYWNMRSATHANFEKQEIYWKLASAHYRKAMMLSPGQRCKKNIVKQLKLYRRHENHFHDVFKNDH